MTDETDSAYRCKLCLTDPDKRISDAARFGLDTAEDYGDVLRHSLQEHPDSDELADVMGIEYATPCARCGGVFLARLRVSDGLIVRNFCGDCADVVERLIHRSVGVGEVLPLVAPSSKQRAGTDQEVEGHD